MSTVERTLGGSEIEVATKATRRRFTLDYKRKIVREADGCKTPGAVGALLRREGLYSSHLTTTHPERLPAGLPHPPARPVEVWINQPKAWATEKASTPIPAGSAILDPLRASSYARSTLGAAGI